jgi:hypothetical protein
MMNRFLLIIIGFLFNSAINMYADSECEKVRNHAFRDGEEITYEISYEWVLPWIKVGVAKFKVDEKVVDNKRLYHVIGTGKSYKSWDWFFEVDDVYQTWIDPVTIKPYYYKRDVNEDGFIIDIEYDFKWDDTVAYTEHMDSKKPLTYDTVKITPCTYDVISLLYYARNLDYSKYKKGEKIPVTILLDNELTDIYFRYLGKEDVKVRKIGKFRCLKFSAFLVEGTMFNEGENMELWVTDDENKIPVQVKTPIIVGSVKAKLIDYKGLKHDLSSRKR